MKRRSFIGGAASVVGLTAGLTGSEAQVAEKEQANKNKSLEASSVNKKMLALRKTRKGAGNVSLQEVPVPEVGPDDVLMKVYAAGVCGSDLLIREDRHFYTAPVTTGHEFSGVVFKAGKNVTRVKEGDYMVADIEVGFRDWLGVSVDGGFANYMLAPEHVVHKVAKHVNLDDALWTEILVATYHQQVERGRVRIGDDVVVIGADAWGTMAVQFAKYAGARRVISIASRNDKLGLQVAKKVGADYTLYSEDNPVEQVMEITNGKGAEFVSMYRFADGEAVQLAIDCARKAYEGPGGKGQIVFAAIWGHKIQVNLDELSLGQLDIKGSWSWNGPESWQQAVKLVEKEVFDFTSMITGRYRLEDWEEAFANFKAKKEVKAVFYPNGRDWVK